MTGTDQEHLVTNIVSHLKSGVKPDMVPRVIEYCGTCTLTWVRR